jgi:hypothetical protein
MTLISQGNGHVIRCEGCGEQLAAAGDWIHDCHTAMAHVEATGHDVWVMHQAAALYGKGERR